MSRRAIARWLRLAAVCFVIILTSAACSFVEEVTGGGGQTSSRPSDGGVEIGHGSDPGSTTGGGSDGGGTTPIGGTPSDPVAVVPYTARWMPSTSPGVQGYTLSIGELSGPHLRDVHIPVGSATSFSGGGLSFAVDLDNDTDYVLTMRAYSADATSPPSNAIVVYGSDLLASAASAAMAGTAQAATADPDVASSAATNENTSTSDASTASAADADTAVEPASDAWLSLEFAGNGAHLVGTLDARIEASALTLTTWLRPVVDGAVQRTLAELVDAEGVSRLSLTVIDGSGLRVTLRDAAGNVASEADFAGVLEHDVWQHLALVIDPTAVAPLALSVGSVVMLPVSDAAAPGLDALADISGELRLGGGDADAGYLGRMGHTAVFARALDASELEVMDADGHAHDPRTDLAADPAGEALLHYWRLGEGVGVETDLGSSDWPVDL
ncbi:MAG: hypothetical protein OEV20_11040, partial [Actinomycetota bacterium]|nr:hypothetical protein [Actinomycetota bacterium]